MENEKKKLEQNFEEIFDLYFDLSIKYSNEELKNDILESYKEVWNLAIEKVKENTFYVNIPFNEGNMTDYIISKENIDKLKL